MPHTCFQCEHGGNTPDEWAGKSVGANGYVVVPRHLLDELVEAADHATADHCRTDTRIRTERAVRAVVEAVGPTREDTK